MTQERTIMADWKRVREITREFEARDLDPGETAQTLRRQGVQVRLRPGQRDINTDGKVVRMLDDPQDQWYSSPEDFARTLEYV
jgi:hypothetical protein